MLPKEVFFEIVKNTPLVSIDLILRNIHGEVFVGLRTNKPAQNYWFVPGGRIYKGESTEAAFRRIVKAELSFEIDYSCAIFRGVYQHMYEDNFSGEGCFGTHYIVLAHEIILSKTTRIVPADLQHRRYEWMSVEDLLANPKVHPNTKFYFMNNNLCDIGKIYPPYQ